MPEVKMLMGNEAAGYAGKLARIGIGCFFPEGPSDEVMETVSELVHRGELDAEVAAMQGERSSIGVQAVATGLGVRTMFACCAEGAAQAVYPTASAASSRFPFLVVIPSRRTGYPGGISSDLSDALAYRDMNVLMFYCEDGQDILDTILQAYKVAEDRRIRLSCIVSYEGWDIGHSVFRVVLPDQEDVDRFLPPWSLPPEEDVLAADWHDLSSVRRSGREDEGFYYMEYQYKLQQAMDLAEEVIEEVGQEYRALFGRNYVGLIETVHADDAEVILVTMGGITTTARFTVERLRAAGHSVGLVKIRAFRPFPTQALRQALSKAKAVVVVDRARSAPVIHDLLATLYNAPHRPLVLGRIAGLGGREVSYYDFARMIQQGEEAAATGIVREELSWEPLSLALEDEEKERVR